MKNTHIVKVGELEKAISNLMEKKENLLKLLAPLNISLTLVKEGDAFVLYFCTLPYNGHGARVIAHKLYGSWFFHSCEYVEFEK